MSRDSWVWIFIGPVIACCILYFIAFGVCGILTVNKKCLTKNLTCTEVIFKTAFISGVIQVLVGIALAIGGIGYYLNKREEKKIKELQLTPD